jgi:two-component system NtrC family sensor kinase
MAEMTKILCVDDERNVLKSLRRLFMDQDDYEIFLAESGEEGLEILKNEAGVSLVISDYRMPGMNGVDFLSKVYEGWPDTIRIVLSGYADTASVVEAINLGRIYKFIPKPWNDEDLKVTVAMALQHQHLKRQNSHLAIELQRKNAELEELNDNLEKKVQQRTEALQIRNLVLAVSQGVLDVLPIAVFGIDPEQMIAQCNDLAQEIFPVGGLGPLGNSRLEVFSADLNQLVDQLGDRRAVGAMVTIRKTNYRAEVRRIDSFTAKGIVVALIPQEF